MRDFPTQYDRRRVGSNAGSRLKQLFRPDINEHGHMDLVEDGFEDLYASIQSHRDSVDLHKILERFQNGDVAALERVQGTYADLTQMPGTYAEMLQTVIDGRAAFDSLPVEVRARFGHSFTNWMSSIGTDDFAEKMQMPKEENAKHEQSVAASDAGAPAAGSAGSSSDA